MHLQAITTKYIGPTNYRGSRIKASAYAGSVTVQYDSGLSTNANHARAAAALASKYNWRNTYASGGMPDETGNVYVGIGPIDVGNLLDDRNHGFDGFVTHGGEQAWFYGNAAK